MASVSKFLKRLWDWLRGHKGSLKPPAPGKVEVSFDMDLNINITHPTVRTDQRPLPLDELASFTCEIGVRDDNQFYSDLLPGQHDIPVGSTPAVQLKQTEIDDGEWFVRVQWTDKRGQKSTQVVTSTTIGTSLAPPAAGQVQLTTNP